MTAHAAIRLPADAADAADAASPPADGAASAQASAQTRAQTRAQARTQARTQAREQGLEAGAFVKSRSDLEIPDLQMHFAAAIMQDHARKAPDRHGYSCHVCLLRPESKGHVGLKSNDPFDHAFIQPNYLTAESDLIAMREGVKIVRNIFAQKAFDPYRGPELEPGGHIQSDEKIDEWIRKHAETIYHPVGTCKMGTSNDNHAVVDGELKVRGVEGLRVVDASVMPTLVGGNTNAPTIMIAEKASDMILGANR